MKYVQLQSLRDLVMFVASSSTMNVIQHLPSDGTHLYFIIGGTLREIFLYFIKTEEALDGRFVVYNTYTGEIEFTERLRTDPNLTSIPIVEIKNQDLLPAELLTRVGSL
jgi:hypothetical protein